MTTYKLFNFVIYPTRKLEYLLGRWHDWLWFYVHYKFGAGPKWPNMKP